MFFPYGSLNLRTSTTKPESRKHDSMTGTADGFSRLFCHVIIKQGAANEGPSEESPDECRGSNSHDLLLCSVQYIFAISWVLSSTYYFASHKWEVTAAVIAKIGKYLFYATKSPKEWRDESKKKADSKKCSNDAEHCHWSIRHGLRPKPDWNLVEMKLCPHMSHIRHSYLSFNSQNHLP